MNKMYFWSFQWDIPENKGFQLFHFGHLLWLVGMIIGCIIYIHFNKKYNKEKRNRNRIIMALAIVGNELIQDVILFCQHNLDVYMLPLHLCGLAIFFCLIHSLGLKKEWNMRGETREKWFLIMQETMLCLCLPGVVLALLFCDWTWYPFFNYINISSFPGHGLIGIYIIEFAVNEKPEIKIRNGYRIYLFLLLFVPMEYLFNSCFDTNYMFLMSPSEGSPLEFIAHWGRTWYLILYFVGVSGIIALMYGIYNIRIRRKN